MTGSTLLLLFLLQVKHFLFDFLVQTPYQLRNKGTYGHPGGLLHSGLHGLGTAVVLFLLAVPPEWLVMIVVGEFLVHYHIDWGKEKIVARSTGTRDASFWQLIGLDQFLHQLTYLTIAAVLYL